MEYYTLSMQYVPTNDKEFLATLLCNRALAHYNIGNYQQGLVDAKSSTRFRPEWYKVRKPLCFQWNNHDLIKLKIFRITFMIAVTEIQGN